MPHEALVTKSVNLAFSGSHLEKLLRDKGITTLITFGISTDMCVSTTIRHGANLGWHMMMVETPVIVLICLTFEREKLLRLRTFISLTLPRLGSNFARCKPRMHV